MLPDTEAMKRILAVCGLSLLLGGISRFARRGRRKTAALLVLGLSACLGNCFGQSLSNSGTVRGSVLDPSGAAIVGAAVQIQNPVSHFVRTMVTDGQGKFEFDNIPYNNYHASAVAQGFQSFEQDLDVRSPIALELKVSLKLGMSNESVNVVAAGDLVESDPTIHTDVDRGLFEKLPLESQSSSLVLPPYSAGGAPWITSTDSKSVRFQTLGRR
jgi:hypothetical protein